MTAATTTEADRLGKAAEQCRFYNGLGGLDDRVMQNIADEHGVALEALRRACDAAPAPSDAYAAALAEAAGYARMGGLDDGVLRDIAHDHKVEFAELRRRYYDE